MVWGRTLNPSLPYNVGKELPMALDNDHLRRRPASSRVLVRGALIAVPLLALVGYVVYWAFFEREHSEWTEQLKLWDGRSVTLHQTSSERVYHGHPHIFGWGGGHPWGSATFEADGKTYYWEGMFIPIAVQIDESGVYLVAYDRETIINRETGQHESFRIYRATGPKQWTEIGPAEFPKRLAVLNTDFANREGVPMDPGNPRFQWSQTAKFWNYLENPNFDYEKDPSEEFLRDFKVRWIRPVAER
jgi:hypothetical protein